MSMSSCKCVGVEIGKVPPFLDGQHIPEAPDNRTATPSDDTGEFEYPAMAGSVHRVDSAWSSWSARSKSWRSPMA
jgi:hypothetical protein